MDKATPEELHLLQIQQKPKSTNREAVLQVLHLPAVRFFL